MDEKTFTDYASAYYTANARIRMMRESLASIQFYQKQYAQRSITKEIYIDALSINLEAYIDQLIHLPDEFWNFLKTKNNTQLLHNIEVLAAIRNNLAHCYRKIVQNSDLLCGTAESDIPEIHEYIEGFYGINDLSKNNGLYPTGLRYKGKYQAGRALGITHSTEIVSENRKLKAANRLKRM